MSYFSDRYSLMKVPIANDSKNLVGLRNAQVGAVHALATLLLMQHYAPDLRWIARRVI